MTTIAPSLVDSATIARAYRHVAATVARGSRGIESLPPAPMGLRRVLVIDDDTKLGAKIVRDLRADGFDASSSVPNEDLVATLFAARPDVILVHSGAEGSSPTLISAADAALYRSKRAGRNCVHMSDGTATGHDGRRMATKGAGTR